MTGGAPRLCDLLSILVFIILNNKIRRWVLLHLVWKDVPGSVMDGLLVALRLALGTGFIPFYLWPLLLALPGGLPRKLCLE